MSHSNYNSNCVISFFKGYSRFDVYQIRFSPWFDNDFFPDDPEVLIRNAPIKPTITGFTETEMIVYSECLSQNFTLKYLAKIVHQSFSSDWNPSQPSFSDLLKKAAAQNRVLIFKKRNAFCRLYFNKRFTSLSGAKHHIYISKF